MNNIWTNLISIQEFFENTFNLTGEEIKDQSFLREGWSSKSWNSYLYRRADVNVVDARETKGLWMMHCCIFPHIHNPAPIFGFDVFAGKNKITGCFHDFSPTIDPIHPMILWFSDQTKDFLWKRTRILPDWALNIFSNSMVAVGNIQDQSEIEKIVEISSNHLNYYISNIGNTSNCVENVAKYQNYYCQQQKLNPHNPKILCNLGMSEIEANEFIEKHLFPELK